MRHNRCPGSNPGVCAICTCLMDRKWSPKPPTRVRFLPGVLLCSLCSQARIVWATPDFSVISFEKGISGSRTQNSLRCVHIIPSGFPRKRKQISKGFLPAGNPGSSVYDLYMIHIAPSGKLSKEFRKFFKNIFATVYWKTSYFNF